MIEIRGQEGPYAAANVTYCTKQAIGSGIRAPHLESTQLHVKNCQLASW